MTESISKRVIATRHNPTGQVIMLPEAERAAYVALLDDYLAGYQPENEREIALVTQIVNANWRIIRLPEPGATDAELAPRSLNRMRAYRAFEKFSGQLRALQAARRAKQGAELTRALQKIASEAGFVFSNPKITNIADHRRTPGPRGSRPGGTPPQTAA